MDSGRPARGLLLAGLLFLALGTCGAPFPRRVSTVSAQASVRCGTVADFYRSHPATHLWFDHGALTPRGREVVSALAATGSDGLDPKNYLRAAAAQDEARLSGALVRYVRDLAGTPGSQQIYYIDEGLRPREPCASVVLDEAAQAPSVDELLTRFREPNRVAATLRAELAAERDPNRRPLLSSDLALARSIGSPKRFVLVDTSSQRLWMIGGNGGTMKVVVGKSGMDTPPMAGLIRFAVVNPYWDIPPDLVPDEVAPRVAAGGPAYLAARNYEAVTSYEDSGVPLESSTIDWEAVRSGSAKIGIRQLPGPDNMMGRVMFMFPNKFGIYLHDTPVRWVFSKTDRRVSHGCVRLERADELYQWLFGRPLESDESTPPQTRESLSEPVPVYIVSLRAGSLGS